MLRAGTACFNEIVKKYGEAAARAQACGFDCVEIHGAHGYLINQFMLSHAFFIVQARMSKS